MMGRPPKPADEVRETIFRIRMSTAERAAVARAAKAAGEEDSTWARELLLGAASRVTGKKGKQKSGRAKKA